VRARAAQVQALDKAIVRMEKEMLRMESPRKRSTPRRAINGEPQRKVREDLSQNGGGQSRGVTNAPRVGDEVLLHSLQRSELNGCRGEVVRDNTTQADGRFAIRLGKVQFNVKPENLTKISQPKVRFDCNPKPGATLGKFMHSKNVVAVGDSIKTLGTKFEAQKTQDPIVGTWAYNVLAKSPKPQYAICCLSQQQQYTIDEDLVYRETLRDKTNLEVQLRPADINGTKWMIADLSPQGTIRLRYDDSEVPVVVRAQYDWTGEGFGRVITAKRPEDKTPPPSPQTSPWTSEDRSRWMQDEGMDLDGWMERSDTEFSQSGAQSVDDLLDQSAKPTGCTTS